MSSTNRGSKREKQDLYSTPEYAFKPLLPYLPKSRYIWEPAAGDGRLIRWINESRLRISSWGKDINHGFSSVDGVMVIDKDYGQDFLQDYHTREVVVTNPPFSLAQEFVSHSLEVADETFMLLRLNFLGAQKRRDWWRIHEPDAIFVLSDRPSFVKGGHDSCEYGWFYWGFRHKGIRHL